MNLKVTKAIIRLSTAKTPLKCSCGSKYTIIDVIDQKDNLVLLAILHEGKVNDRNHYKTITIFDMMTKKLIQDGLTSNPDSNLCKVYGISEAELKNYREKYNAEI